MSTATPDKPRTRTLETRTTEEIPVSETRSFGMSIFDWLDSAPADDLAISTVKVYRREPPSGFLVKLHPAEPIDEDWIAAKYGGGLFAVQLKCKDGRSAYEANVRIDGEPKLTPQERGPATLPSSATPAPNAGTESAIERLGNLVDKLVDKISALQAPPAPPAPSAAGDASVKIMAEAASEGIKLVAAQSRDAGGESFSKQFQEALIKRMLDPPKERSLDEELQRLKTLKEILQPAQSEKGIADQIAGLGAVIKTLDEIRGDGGGGRGDWKAAIVEQVGNAVPHLVEGVKTIMDGRTKEADAVARAQAARAQAAASVARMAGVQPAPGTPMASGPAAPGATPAAAPATAADWGGPLNVVPISAAAPPAAAAEETPAVTPVQAQEATMIDRYLKNRVVQLISEGAHPGMVLDFIDGASPQIGALLSRATERQIRDFLASDEILVQATRLPNFEAFLKGLMAELSEDEGETTDAPPSPSRIQ